MGLIVWRRGLHGAFVIGEWFLVIGEWDVGMRDPGLFMNSGRIFLYPCAANCFGFWVSKRYFQEKPEAGARHPGPSE